MERNNHYLPMYEIDLHVHTLASGHAFGTLEEIARAAKAIGMKAVAITDHGPNLKGAPISAYFSVLCYIAPSEMEGVRILKGIEANILDTDGTIDVPHHAKPGFDIVLAYIHPFTAYRDGGEKANTRAILAALDRNPCIDVLAHPVTQWFAVDIKQIVRRACSLGIAIELNDNALKSGRLDPEKLKLMVEETLDAGGRFAVSSDAHIPSSIGDSSHAGDLIDKLAIPSKSILNASLESVLDFVKARKELKKR